MNEIEAIRREAQRRKITRLAHFTPMRNLVHIATGNGVSSTKFLREDERAEFHPQDRERLDGFPDHICCSIQYPNAYYLRTKRQQATGETRLFPGWVCLLIDAKHLWRQDTLLCPHNAAGAQGANVRGGADCFASMFAASVTAPQRDWHRQQQPDCCPTDAQAEVLVHRLIPFKDVLAVAVENEGQAADTYAALTQLQAPLEQLPFVVAPDFYAPTKLAVGLAQGRRPVETTWHPGGHDRPPTARPDDTV